MNRLSRKAVVTSSSEVRTVAVFLLTLVDRLGWHYVHNKHKEDALAGPEVMRGTDINLGLDVSVPEEFLGFTQSLQATTVIVPQKRP